MQTFSHKDKTELDLGRQEIRIKYSSIKWLNKNNDAVIKKVMCSTNCKWKLFKINEELRGDTDLLANCNEWNFYEF